MSPAHSSPESAFARIPASFNHLKLNMKKSAVFSEDVPPVKVP